jgi:hypothetical protein
VTCPVTSLEFAFSISEGCGPQRTHDRRRVREPHWGKPLLESEINAVAPTETRPNVGRVVILAAQTVRVNNYRRPDSRSDAPNQAKRWVNRGSRNRQNRPYKCE